MCMSSTKFSMEWKKSLNDFVGVGYKNIRVETNGKKKIHSYGKYSKKWKEASFSTYTKDQREPCKSIYANDGTEYPPGFHIFTNQQDAKDYASGVVVKVEYRGVLAFGQNETESSTRNGDCVIADKIRVVEVVDWNDND